MKERFTVVPAVYVLFQEKDAIVLLRRANTGYKDGMYGLPSGHVDGNEPALQAAIREAHEEVGVTIRPEQLLFSHLLHRRPEAGDRYGKERMDIFFTARSWEGTLQNMEPEKCDDLRWCPVGALPDNTIPEVRFVLAKIAAGEQYSDYNFEHV